MRPPSPTMQVWRLFAHTVSRPPVLLAMLAEATFSAWLWRASVTSQLPAGRFPILAASALAAILVAAAQFLFARRYGGAKGSASRPAIALWLGLSLLVSAAGFWLGFLTLRLVDIHRSLPVALFSLYLLPVLIQLGLMPLQLRAVAAAHGGHVMSFEVICDLLARRPALAAGYFLLLALVNIRAAIRVVAFRPGLYQPVNGDMVVAGIDAAVRIWLPALFLIAVYRVMRESVPPIAREFA